MNVPLVILSPALWLRLCCTVGQDGILRGVGNPAGRLSGIAASVKPPPVAAHCTFREIAAWCDRGSATPFVTARFTCPIVRWLLSSFEVPLSEGSVVRGQRKSPVAICARPGGFGRPRDISE
jgi:hypothetical protein